MAKKRASFDVVLVIQIVLAVFLISLGIAGINDWNSNANQFSRGVTRFFGGTSNPFNLVVAICELVAGVIVLAGVFVAGQARLLFAATLVISILWAVLIVITFFTQDAFQTGPVLVAEPSERGPHRPADPLAGQPQVRLSRAAGGEPTAACPGSDRAGRFRPALDLGFPGGYCCARTGRSSPLRGD